MSRVKVQLALSTTRGQHVLSVSRIIICFRARGDRVVSLYGNNVGISNAERACMRVGNWVPLPPSMRMSTKSENV